MEDYASSTAIRTLFSQELSTMYKMEVPLYGDLLDLISAVNSDVLARDPELKLQLEATRQLERLHLERHGAIRLGSPEEMATMARFLRVMGMYPVGYYDLAQAALPVHATCFRTLDMASLSENPFRLFVSLLRPPLLPDDMRDRAQEVVSRRKIFDDRVLQLIEKAEKNSLRLTRLEAADFITHGIATFKWHASSVVSVEEYRDFDSQVPLLADIVCFRGPHINHLTPRTLDIDRAQEMMRAGGFPAKAVIEGPPRRKCPILLRQTSFKALEEHINFTQGDGTMVRGAHTARFGEIEERGAALTRKGRELYDKIIATCRSDGIDPSNEEAYKAAFAEFPDDWESMRREGLAWFRYTVVDRPAALVSLPAFSRYMVENFETHLPWFLRAGWVRSQPIVYEDFLPFSAAGIFESNLKGGGADGRKQQPGSAVVGDGREALQSVLDDRIEDEMTNYWRLQQDSLDSCKAMLAELL